jgi:hypothetical protein
MEQPDTTSSLHPCRGEQRTGDATKSDGPAGGYAGVPTVFLQHTRVSSGGLTREQENPEVREGVGIANQSSPTGFFLGLRRSCALELKVLDLWSRLNIRKWMLCLYFMC